MEPQEIDVLALESDQQRPELVDPGEGALDREAPFVHSTVEMALPTAFRCFPGAFVLINVRNHPIVPEQFARSTGVKTTIRVEERPFIHYPDTFQCSEQLFEGLRQLIRIVVVASNDTGRRNNVSMPINQG